ncbi:heavy-metal-associated domain-containing protein [Halanaerobaculum tunisiense]
MKHATFKVTGPAKVSGKQAIKAALTQVEGVKKAQVNLNRDQVTVRFDTSQTELSRLKDEVRAAGYEVSS